MNKHHMSVEECGEYVSLVLAEASVSSKIEILTPIAERLQKNGKENQSIIVWDNIYKLMKKHEWAINKTTKFLNWISLDRRLTGR